MFCLESNDYLNTLGNQVHTMVRSLFLEGKGIFQDDNGLIHIAVNCKILVSETWKWSQTLSLTGTIAGYSILLSYCGLFSKTKEKHISSFCLTKRAFHIIVKNERHNIPLIELIIQDFNLLREEFELYWRPIALLIKNIPSKRSVSTILSNKNVTFQ